MPNILTDLKDIKIAQNALMPWMTTLLPLGAFSTNFSPAPADKSESIKVPIIGKPSASSDFEGDYTKDADSESSTVMVTLDRHKFKTVHMSAIEASTLPVPMLESWVSAAAQQLANDVLEDILSSVTAAEFGPAALADVSEDSFNYKSIVALRKACSKVKMPKSQRALILDSTHYSSLLGDPIVANSSVTSLVRQGVVEGKVQRIAGFDIYETECVPDNGERLAGFGVHPSAIAVAMRYLQPSAKYDEAGAVTDPVTGLTFGYKRFSETKSDKVYITLEALYGFQVLRKDALQRITAAAVTPATPAAK